MSDVDFFAYSRLAENNGWQHIRLPKNYKLAKTKAGMIIDKFSGNIISIVPSLPPQGYELLTVEGKCYKTDKITLKELQSIGDLVYFKLSDIDVELYDGTKLKAKAFHRDLESVYSQLRATIDLRQPDIGKFELTKDERFAADMILRCIKENVIGVGIFYGKDGLVEEVE